MKQFASIALAAMLLAIIGGLTGFTFLHSSGANTVINIKGLDDDGVVLIAPPDLQPDGQNISQEHASLMDAVGPFGVVVKNTTKKDVIGCSLKWELISSTGEVRVLRQGYSNPGVLLGLQPLDPNMVGRTSLINANSSRFLSLDPRMKNILETIGTPLPERTIEKNREYVQTVKSKYQTQLKSLVAITISIEGLIFADGEYLGSDTTAFYKHLQASVDARRDVGNAVDTAAREGKHASEAVQGLTSKMSNSPFLIKETGDQEYDKLYDRSFRDSVKELNSIQIANGDEAVSRYIRPTVSENTPKLHKKVKN